MSREKQHKYGEPEQFYDVLMFFFFLKCVFLC